MQHSMHTIDTATAQKLIDRFFIGDTSLDEEQALYAYFAQAKIDGDLARYAPMFRDLAAANRYTSATVVEKKPRRKTFALSWRHIAAAAAVGVTLVVAGVTMFALRSYHENAMLARCYEGSYVIEHGKRIDDLRSIRPQIEQTLRSADAIESKVHGDEIVEEAARDVLNNIDDPAERQRLARLLD